MTDFLTPEDRSRLMSKIRGKDTRPEKTVRQLLWHAGFRYRLNDRKLPGTPDLALARYRTAVFVNGCFWHRHDCRKGTKLPKTNRQYWLKKFADNAARDAANLRILSQYGWTTTVIWECRMEEGTQHLLLELSEKRRREKDRT